MPGTMPNSMTFAVEKMIAGGNPSVDKEREEKCEDRRPVSIAADILDRGGDVSGREEREELGQESRGGKVDNAEEKDDRGGGADFHDAHAHMLFQIEPPMS